MRRLLSNDSNGTDIESSLNYDAFICFKYKLFTSLALTPRHEPSSSNTSSKSNGSTPNQHPPKPAAAPVPTQSFSSNFPPKHLEKDEMRLKSVQMILNALRYTELPDGTHDPEEIAVRVEEKLFSVGSLS
ncbi:unnamed protein product [Strongylus vulgaris]|uniref:Uncharacterized protein n=1 Tax=Strongylus vulgaris TaxID=40348 RepID=A0A3P7KVM6_STRVU|nr:unnamed protein product [Strongylus vulgaris]